MSDKKDLTRRDFFKGAAISGAAVAVASALPVGSAEAKPCRAADLPKKWDMEADVVVVGAGCSGLSAAVEASRAGAKVVLLEKSQTIGGDIIVSAGIFYSAKTKHHSAAGITEKVEPEDFWAYMQTGIDDEPLGRVRDNTQLSPIYYGITKHNPEILKNNAYASADLIAFVESFGVEFNPMNKLKPYQLSAKRGQMGIFINNMLKEAQKNGAKLMTETRAGKLYVDAKGAVAGLKATRKGGKEINVKSRAVIIATGGFLNSEYLMKRYLAYWAKVPTGFTAIGQGVSDGHTGDGILMAKEIGASLEDMNAGVKLFAGNDGSTPSVSWILFDTAPAILVNEKGQRLANEVVARYNGCALAVLKTNSKAGYAVFDNKTFNSPANDRFGLAKALEAKGLFKADTVADLAAAGGIEAKGLQETIDLVNRDAKTGVDSQFGKSGPIFQSLEAPFYISRPHYPVRYKTEGGIETNTSYQVLEHTEEKVIPGLYAVGATCGSISTRHSDCCNSGRIAGRTAAAEAKGTVKGKG